MRFPFSDGVWYDPTAQLYKLWYVSGNCGNCIGYAQSTDGINWVKPVFTDLDPASATTAPTWCCIMAAGWTR